MGTVVPFSLDTCRGKPCDDPARCLTMGKCGYKSSADEAKEQMEMALTPLPVRTDAIVMKVQDFLGQVDGKGVKQVMVSPKPGIQYIAPAFVEGIGGVLTYGAKKYADSNWMRGMSWTTVFGGVMRHLWAWFRGEDIDPVEKGGSGLPHLHHAACGIMFLCQYAQDQRHQQFDDRVFK